MKLKSYISLFLALLISLGGCDSLKLETQQDPNALTSSQFDVGSLLVSVQLNAANVFEELQDPAAQVTRMRHMFGPQYTNAYTPQNFDNAWSFSYAGQITDADLLIPKAEQSQFFDQAGVAQILKAYTLISLVDFFGDIPYAEAGQGVTNTNPKVTSGSVVYAEAIKLLDAAIVNLNKTSVATQTADLFFTGTISANKASWIRVANSLKFRVYVQTRKVDATANAKAQAILTDNNFITTQNFSFKYSQQNLNPNSRHPRFGGNYDNGAADYMSVYYMSLFTSTNDPRVRYYFYRQSTAAPTVNQQPCIAFAAKPAWYSVTDPYCRTGLGAGYWGRDHGNDDGIPPDGTLRTIYGVYPIGGKFDGVASGSRAVSQAAGLRGAGIAPVFMSFFMNFLRAEAALTMGTGDVARTQFETGVRGSISAVIAFGRTQPGYDAAFEPSTVAIDTYVNARLAAYDAAADNEARLAIVVTEYYKSAFGNGLEAYNAYRRTGYPANVQPTSKTATPGGFIRSFLYPANYVFTNGNATQKSVETKVFWDNGSTTLK